MSRFVSCLGFGLFLLVSLVGAWGDSFFEVEAWSEFDPIVADGSERPIPREVVTERLLDEIQFTVSGMVYGYQFDYVPGDPGRGIDESFELTPYGFIQRGDRSLVVHQTWVEDNRLYARVYYEVADEQEPWYQGWHSGANERSSGVGTASLFLGPTQKTKAISDAIRHAVREHVRAQVFTRPLRITGAAILENDPLFSVTRGNYQASVDVLIQVDAIERFSTY